MQNLLLGACSNGCTWTCTSQHALSAAPGQPIRVLHRQVTSSRRQLSGLQQPALSDQMVPRHDQQLAWPIPRTTQLSTALLVYHLCQPAPQGMALPALAAGSVQLPVLSMLQQGLIDAPVFGLYTVPDASAAGAGGELTIGGWAADRVQGNLTW